MATAGGGAFFGKVGSFEDGFEADALVLDESRVPTPLFAELSLEDVWSGGLSGCEQVLFINMYGCASGLAANCCFCRKYNFY